MSCTLESNGQLKDASTINWYNDLDDDTPIPAPPPLPAFNGTLIAFVSCHSGQALKLTEKIHEATNAAPAKQLAPVPPQIQPAPKHSHLICHHNGDNDELPVLEDFSDDKEEEEKNNNKDLEEAYQRTKAFGDKDHEDCKQAKKDKCSADLKEYPCRRKVL
ncbi:hypothetical protein BDR04DRAFT_1160296 [Suillus decipiens]|nr:hypothetical protein BDR04DRAFT_1160296 [Suillus decipiens]